MRKILFILVVMIGGAPYPFVTEASPTHVHQRDTLRDLHQARLVVNIGLSLEGPTKQRLRSDVEQHLQHLPLRLLPENHPTEFPVLIIEVAVLKRGKNVSSYFVTAQVYQKVTLVREPQVTAAAATWRSFLIGDGGIEQIRHTVGDVVEAFVADYRSVNGE